MNFLVFTIGTMHIYILDFRCKAYKIQRIFCQYSLTCTTTGDEPPPLGNFMNNEILKAIGFIGILKHTQSEQYTSRYIVKQLTKDEEGRLYRQHSVPNNKICKSKSRIRCNISSEWVLKVKIIKLNPLHLYLLRISFLTLLSFFV